MSSNSDDEIRFGKCDSCDKALTDDNWCRNCSAKRFKEKFDKWTSGNEVIDKFIRQIQLKAISHHKVLEWIPFEDIPNEDEGERIEHIADGGHGSVYKAKWKLGPIVYYDNDNQEWHRAGKTDIVLKSINALNDTNNIPDKFFEEIEAQMTSFVEFGYIIRQKDHEIWSEIESIEKNMYFDIAPEKASLDYKTLASYTSQLITVSQEIASDTSKRISVSSIQDS
ncbi:serine/threonine protein kinase [Gigaspora margarita]|uniref:Serine/threonine protein kinase n=1 Tax=Gigaspora margarita TaxID=4874 RepID=A0A8H4AAR4_GIGMA|nr:serine/threonine protein kinase [Gigaspora margarita]